MFTTESPLDETTKPRQFKAPDQVGLHSLDLIPAGRTRAGRAAAGPFWKRMFDESFWSSPGLGESLSHGNDRDREERGREDAEREERLRKDLERLGGMDGEEADAEFEKLFSGMLDGHLELDPEEALGTVKGFEEAVRQVSAGRTGPVSAGFMAGEAFLDVQEARKAKDGAVEVVFRSLGGSGDASVTPAQLAAMLRLAARKGGLTDEAPLAFSLNGVRLVPDMAGAEATDAGGATFCVFFDDESSERALAAGTAEIDLMKASGAAEAVRKAADDRAGVGGPAMQRKLKAVCVLEDGGAGQKVFQVSRPFPMGGNVVAYLQDCTSWSFSEIEDDPQTTGALELADALSEAAKKCGGSGLVFLKARSKTYGISGVDFVDTQGASEGKKGFGRMLALVVRPWSDLEESSGTGPFWKRMLDESFWRGA